MTTFQDARAFLLKHRTDYDAAVKGFRWPDPVPFNWALDWFDAELARNPESKDRPALWIVDAGSNKETKLSFEALSRRSNQVANFLRARGLKRGDHLLLLLGNVVPLWETMLAAMKLGVVVIPATTLLTPDELRDRLDRGRAKVVVASQDQVAKFAGLGGDQLIRIVAGASSKYEGWLPYEQAADFSEDFNPDGPTKPDDPMLLYFTSGTTAKPKLVRHSQRSYPVGGLSTMYWLGLKPGDVHLNISSPGWAKHAWSCLFAPWNAGATVFVVNQPRFDAKGLLATIGRCGVTTLCAPPTVWRLFIQEKLATFKVSLREVCGAGEQLNPEGIDQVRAALGLTLRDVFKSSDYRISPFELESILLEHEAVAEAAVVPSPDPIRLAIPKAYVLLVSGAARSGETALSIFRHLHTRLAPFKRIRRIELVTELPKTISGKIRRVHLRRLEHDNDRGDALRGQEFREEDFPELQKVRSAGSVEN